MIFRCATCGEEVAYRPDYGGPAMLIEEGDGRLREAIFVNCTACGMRWMATPAQVEEAHEREGEFWRQVFEVLRSKRRSA